MDENVLLSIKLIKGLSFPFPFLYISKFIFTSNFMYINQKEPNQPQFVIVKTTDFIVNCLLFFNCGRDNFMSILLTY